MKLEETETKSYDIGVMIGRFQVDKLHKGHLYLIDSVLQNHKKVIVFLGVGKGAPTKNYALDYANREKLIKSAFPNIVVAPISDMQHDEDWSKQVDSKIKEIFPHGSVLLYGGRESFIPHYSGKHDTTTIPNAIDESASRIRLDIAREVRDSDDFRAGIIYATYNKYPNALPCVDVAVVDRHKNNVLLARKPNEKLFRFPGGHVDPSDKSFEAACRREAREELGDIEIADPKYITSLQVDDWRYRKADTKIITALYQMTFVYGKPSANDDIEEVKWVPIDSLKEDGAIDRTIMPEHRELMEIFINQYTPKLETA